MKDESETRIERIKRVLEGLRDKQGRLTAHALVRAAKNPKHPLHNEFEWDDAKAAYANRIDRANELIRYVTVVVVDRTQTIVTPFYVRDPQKRGDEPGMIAINSAMINRREATAIMMAELARCEQSIKRARAVVHTLDKSHRGLSAHFEKMLQDIVEVRRILDAA